MMGGEENVRFLCLSIESPFIRGWQALLMATSEEIGVWEDGMEVPSIDGISVLPWI